MVTARQGIVGILVTLMVTIMVGIIVVMNLITSQTQAGWSASANSTWSTLQSNTWIAFTLLIIIPIIVASVAILGYVRGMG